MAFISFPRTFDAFLNYGFFSHSPANEKVWYRWLNKLTFFLHIWQYFSGFGLTYISARENFSKWLCFCTHSQMYWRGRGGGGEEEGGRGEEEGGERRRGKEGGRRRGREEEGERRGKRERRRG